MERFSTFSPRTGSLTANLQGDYVNFSEFQHLFPANGVSDELEFGDLTEQLYFKFQHLFPANGVSDGEEIFSFKRSEYCFSTFSPRTGSLTQLDWLMKFT